MLTVAGMDHQAAALAVGAARPGVLFDSLGTAEALLRHVPAPQDGAGLRADIAGLVERGITVGRAVVPGRLCVLGALLTGLTLERVCALVGATSREARHALGEAALLHAAPGRPGDAVTSPSLRVITTEAGLSLDGVTESTTPAAVMSEVLDHLGVRSDELLADMEAFAGRRVATVATGGWLNNPAVAAARRRQHPGLRVTGLREAGATGAALLAGVAAGALRRSTGDDVPRWADGSPAPRLDVPDADAQA